MSHDTHQHHHGPGHGHGHGHGHSEEDTAALIEQLDLDGEVFDSYLASVTGLVRDQAAASGLAVRRVLDLGCGTGNGALKLAQLFTGAEVIAVDSAAPMLARLRAKALDLGLADRVRVLESDLDQAWPAVGTVDLAWMSMALHHLADPKRGLAEMLAALSPGGLLALAELAEAMRFLPDDLSDLEARCFAAQAEVAAAEMPYLGADWGPLLTGAGFDIVAQRTFDLEVRPPLSPSAARYALGYLRRSRSAVEAVLGADDLATLDAITSEDGLDSLLHRSDLHLRGTRTLWIATPVPAG